MKNFDIITPKQYLDNAVLSLVERIQTELSLSRKIPFTIRLDESLTVITETIKIFQSKGWFCKLDIEPYGKYLLTLSNQIIIG